MDSLQLQRNWDSVCDELKHIYSDQSSQIEAILSRLQPQAMSDGFLMLTADSPFMQSWVQRNYLDLIRQTLEKMYQIPFEVIIELDDSSQISSPVTTTPAPSVNVSTFSKQATSSVTAKPAQENLPYVGQGNPPYSFNQHLVNKNQPHGSFRRPVDSSLNSLEERNHNVRNDSSFDDVNYDHYLNQDDISLKNPSSLYSADSKGEDFSPSSNLTFENFVIGDSNRMAYSMAVSVAEMPGKQPLNPLFIYGKSGLGKTHLMRAIQNYVRETQPFLKSIYIDSAEFLSDYMEASAAHDKEKSSYKNFKTKYEEADILLIDDIQYLQGKKQTLDIVFQIFNNMIGFNKQIVISADRAPKNIDIDERYHSRFSGGGTIDIQPPEIETKLGIVNLFVDEYKKNEGFENLVFPQDIRMYIAENSSSNIRELKSAVTKVIYQMRYFDQSSISIEEVQSLLQNHFSGGASRNLSVEEIQKEVENFFKVKHSDLVGPKRTRNIVYPRQIAIYLCRQILDLPFNYIAKKFNRDHSTAMHSVNTVEELIRESPEVSEEIETLKQIIRDL